MRVLVVDDHLPTIELMALMLTTFGHVVISVNNVADALHQVATDRPDIILSDLTFSGVKSPRSGESAGDGYLPDAAATDGHGLARAVRANPANDGVGMLAISGVTSPAELQAAIDSGFDGVVAKPFDVRALLDRIDALGRARTE